MISLIKVEPPLTGVMLIVYTGGTFGMRDHGRGLEASTDLGDIFAALIADLEPDGTRDAWRYVANDHIIDSADATLEHGLAISARIRENLENVRGVIVVHGTDTLAYTSAVSAFALADVRVPIVFTGSQRPIGEPDSDAPANFRAAYREASEGRPGVRIAFGGRVLPAVRATKVSSDADEAFAAHRPAVPQASLLHGMASRLEGIASPGARHGFESSSSVGLLRVFPGLSPELLRTFADHYPGGLVLECYGAGTAPTSMPGFAETVTDIINGGTPVVAITQCLTGSVQLERYALGAELQRAGVWSGYDLTGEAALAKLGVLTAIGLSWEERRAAFATNLVGEQRME